MHLSVLVLAALYHKLVIAGSTTAQPGARLQTHGTEPKWPFLAKHVKCASGELKLCCQHQVSFGLDHTECFRCMYYFLFIQRSKASVTCSSNRFPHTLTTADPNNADNVFEPLCQIIENLGCCKPPVDNSENPDLHPSQDLSVPSTECNPGSLVHAEEGDVQEYQKEQRETGNHGKGQGRTGGGSARSHKKTKVRVGASSTYKIDAQPAENGFGKAVEGATAGWRQRNSQ